MKIEVVSRELLETLAAQASEQRPFRKGYVTSKNPQRFNLDAFIAEHPEIHVKRIDPYEGGRRIILARCAFDSNHGQGTDVAIIENSDGALGYACQHNG